MTRSFVDLLVDFAHGRLDPDPEPRAPTPTRPRRRDRTHLPPQRRAPASEAELVVDLDWNDGPRRAVASTGRDVIPNSDVASEG